MYFYKKKKEGKIEVLRQSVRRGLNVERSHKIYDVINYWSLIVNDKSDTEGGWGVQNFGKHADVILER